MRVTCWLLIPGDTIPNDNTGSRGRCMYKETAGIWDETRKKRQRAESWPKSPQSVISLSLESVESLDMT